MQQIRPCQPVALREFELHRLRKYRPKILTDLMNGNLVVPDGCQLIFSLQLRSSIAGERGIETRKRVMLRNILFTATVAAIVTPIVLTTDAMAGSCPYLRKWGKKNNLPTSACPKEMRDIPVRIDQLFS
jgi:hypothetical protein